jgi:hypothetical protein
VSEVLRSILTGTIPLDIMIAVAVALTVSRGAGDPRPAARTRTAWIAAAALAVQGVHFSEELATGFHHRFPELIGLHPWPIEFFASLNLFWIGVWALSLIGVRAGFHAALFPIWFLGIGGAVNCVAHPLLALAAGGYFPGLFTCPLSGLTGILLLRQLASSTGDGRLVPSTARVPG